MPNPMDAILSRIEAGNQRRKFNALNDIFAQAYEPGQRIETPMYGPTQSGDALPPVIQQQPGRINVQNALAAMATSGQPGMALQAFQLQQQMDAARAAQQKPLEQLKLEYALKDALQTGQMDQAKALFQELRGSGGGGYGTSMKIKPTGPEITFDPDKAASTELDRRKFAWETGGGMGGGTGGAPMGGIPPKAAAEANTARLKSLQESASQRTSALDTAEKFLDLFEKNKMRSGAGRQAAGFIPGVYTGQGQLDEEFNAFAETAARQALKAAGEQRQTDADVKGMKQAMFGTGRDEKTNKILLKNYIEQQLKDENAYRSLTGQAPRQPKEYAGVTDVGGTPAQSVEAPKQGTIDSGFLFIGGDPANRKNWVKAK